jgi:acetylglutamate kinase
MNRRILMKIGGKAFDEPGCFNDLANGIKANPGVDYIIVHGGGAEISLALCASGRETCFVDGVRVTEAQDLEIVEEVLEKINERIAGSLSSYGVSCERLSGKTDSLLVAKPMKNRCQSLGFVGEITESNPEPVLTCLVNRKVPIVSPISSGIDGHTYNVNADTAAAALAVASGCTDLVYFTDVEGVQIDGLLCSKLSVAEANNLIAAGKIKGGMVAKLRSAFEALSCEVPQVHILKWQGQHTLAQLLNGHKPVGTTIHR